MNIITENKYNPNPITKLISVLLLGITVLQPISNRANYVIVFILAIFLFINNYKKHAIFIFLFYIFLNIFPGLDMVYDLSPFLKIFISLFIIVRMFYLPFLAGDFLIKTSDVGCIISSMDKLKIPQAFSIPIAVMFRFFPSYKQERKNIKMALKIRGITFINPIHYLEYVSVPLIIISSNIADDIAKAADVKCIENPIQKTRYIKVKVGTIDFIYLGSIIAIIIGGFIC